MGVARLGVGDGALARASMARLPAARDLYRERGRRPGTASRRRSRIDGSRCGGCWRSGSRPRAQMTLEVGVFAAATALAGAARADGAGGAPDRAQHRRAHVHGAARHRVGRRGARRPGDRARRVRAARSRAGWTALAFGVGVHGCGGAGVSARCPRTLIARVHQRRRRAGRRRRAAVRRRRLSAVRRPPGRRRPACCAASATRGRRCCGTRRPLVHRPAARLPAVLPLGLGVVGLWWGLSIGLDHLRRRADVVWWRRIQGIRFARWYSQIEYVAESGSLTASTDCSTEAAVSAGYLVAT